MHNAGFVHRDLKPENFLLGLGINTNIIHLIDYGLSKLVFDTKTNTHIPYRENKSMTGTARYVSVSTHLGIE